VLADGVTGVIVCDRDIIVLADGVSGFIECVRDIIVMQEGRVAMFAGASAVCAYGDVVALQAIALQVIKDTCYADWSKFHGQQGQSTASCYSCSLAQMQPSSIAGSACQCNSTQLQTLYE
jgi:hypothetical protein